MKIPILLSICMLLMSVINTAHAAQTSLAEAEGTACMGDARSKKQTEQAALVDAKRQAIEFVSTHVTSETEVMNSQLEKDLIFSYTNADVKVIRELEKKWYKDAASGDCYMVRIRAEVIPHVQAIAKTPPVSSTGPNSSNRQNQQPEFTSWLSASDYQNEFNRQFRLGRYPVYVEGRNENGVSEFRANFTPFPPGYFYFWSHHDIDKGRYDRKNDELSGKGFKLKSLQTFIDRTGIERYQATWIDIR